MTVKAVAAEEELERALGHERVLSKCRLFMDTLIAQLEKEYEQRLAANKPVRKRLTESVPEMSWVKWADPEAR